jgi:hypothetical protein
MQDMHTRPDIAERHHASYIFERGVWRATCRLCGHTITDPGRRQAATLFRNHIRDAARNGPEFIAGENDPEDVIVEP